MFWSPGSLKEAKSPMLAVAADNDDIIPLHVNEKVAQESEGSE